MIHVLVCVDPIFKEGKDGPILHVNHIPPKKGKKSKNIQNLKRKKEHEFEKAYLTHRRDQNGTVPKVWLLLVNE